MTKRITFQIGKPAVAMFYSVGPSITPETPVAGPVRAFHHWVGHMVSETASVDVDRLVDHMVYDRFRGDGDGWAKGDPKFRIDTQPQLSDAVYVLDLTTGVVELQEIQQWIDSQPLTLATKLLNKVTAVNKAMDDAEEPPTGGSYNELYDITSDGLKQLLSKLGA